MNKPDSFLIVLILMCVVALYLQNKEIRSLKREVQGEVELFQQMIYVFEFCFDGSVISIDSKASKIINKVNACLCEASAHLSHTTQGGRSMNQAADTLGSFNTENPKGQKMRFCPALNDSGHRLNTCSFDVAIDGEAFHTREQFRIIVRVKLAGVPVYVPISQLIPKEV